jgi:hypothetical protein
MSAESKTPVEHPFAVQPRRQWVVIRAFRQPAFVLATLLLLAAAIGLNTAVARLQVHFKKLPLPLAHDLSTIPAKFGNWVQVSRDQPLDAELQQTLGTDKYIFRDYIDLSVFTDPKVLDLFADKTLAEQQRQLAVLQVQHPEGVINVDVTYYTGLVDTVAHIPDRCYIASGYEPTDYTEPVWDLGFRKLGVRFINFEDQTGPATSARNVAYFFHVNGHYESDPEMVRASLQNLLEKYGYYAKVELMTQMTDQGRSALVMQDFLRQALPSIEATLPDWAKATAAGGQKPVAGG